MKNMYVFHNRDNVEVTKMYCDIICNALEKKGYKCTYVKSLDGIPKESLILFIVGVDAFRYYIKGYHNYILWIQGLSGEESYMRNHSKLRMGILNKIDSYAIKNAKFVFFVSEKLREYYEKITKRSLKDKGYIMPCFNEKLDVNVFDSKDYSKKVFCYAGSLAKWQCFSQTVDLYKSIEEKHKDAFFKVLTFQKEEAEKILKEEEIQNYIVKTVPQNEVNRELQEATYGFILRDDIPVNQVATPTKFSSYLAAGVLPIYSACLEDFYKHTADNPNFFPIKNKENNEELFAYLLEDKDVDSVKNSVQELFSSYYSPKYHIDQIQKKMGDFL